MTPGMAGRMEESPGGGTGAGAWTSERPAGGRGGWAMATGAGLRRGGVGSVTAAAVLAAAVFALGSGRVGGFAAAGGADPFAVAPADAASGRTEGGSGVSAGCGAGRGTVAAFAAGLAG